MKKQMFALTLALAIAAASSTAKADTFGFTYTGNDGVVGIGTLTGDLSATVPGEYLITSGDISVTGASAALNGPGVLLLLFSGVDTTLFPFSSQVLPNNDYLQFQNVASGNGVFLISNGSPDYWMTGGSGSSMLNDTGTLSVTSATPEPSSLLLLGTGLLGVAGMARRRFTHV